MRDLCKSLLGVFKPHVARYPSLEGAILVDEMAALNQDTSKDIVDELRNVGATVAKAMTQSGTAFETNRLHLALLVVRAGCW